MDNDTLQRIQKLEQELEAVKERQRFLEETLTDMRASVKKQPKVQPYIQVPLPFGMSAANHELQRQNFARGNLAATTRHVPSE